MPVGGWVVNVAVHIGDSAHDDTADGPEHLQHLRAGGSQLDRHDLTAVCRRVRDENAPWHTLQQLGHKHDRERLGKVEREDEGVQEHETGDCRPSVSDAAGQGTSNKNPDKRTELPGDLKCRLPFGLDDVFVAVRYTVFLFEIWQRNEATHEEHIVGFHNLGPVLVLFARRVKGSDSVGLTIQKDMTKAQKVAMG